MKRFNTHAALVVSALVALAAGCATPAPNAQAPDEPAIADKPDTWGPQSPQPAWWADAKPCPEGTKMVGNLPPKGNVLECVKPNGVRHGNSSVWFDNGHEGTYVQYKNGMRHGRFLHWLHGRKMIEGEFEEGRRNGEWTYWFDDNSDWDTQSRMKRDQPVVVETYNKGIVLTRERRGRAAPEDMAPEPPHDEVATTPAE